MTDAGRVADHNVEAGDTTDSTGLGLLDVVERWKQQFSAGRVAPPPASSAPGPVRITEEMAWRGIGVVQIVKCACGGAFRVKTADPDPAMKQHQVTLDHRRWRERHGL